MEAALTLDYQSAALSRACSRRILHYNVTAHPTADWTLQQFREALSDDRPHQCLIHDRDSIFSSELDEELQTSFGLRVLRTPPRWAVAEERHSFCGCTTFWRDTGVKVRPLVRTAHSPYADTPAAILWKVELTTSPVCTLGVPSITLAKVFNTSG